MNERSPSPTHTAPHGSWSSPITAELIASGSRKLGHVVLDGDDTYWVEGRAAENGRYVVVRRPPGAAPEVHTKEPYSVRSAVHEYGGGAFAVRGGLVVFSNHSDQRLYLQARADAHAVPLTAPVRARYGDLVIDARRGRIVCVREEHGGGPSEPTNTLVSVELQGGATKVLASGHDFYASARLSPCGRWLCWLSWDHPNMPWDGTELWLAELSDDGQVLSASAVAGGRDESIFQPMFSPRGELTFVSDRSGFWNLYQRRDGHDVALCPREAEFGVPQWIFGMSTYAFVSDSQMVCAYTEQGAWHLASLDVDTGAFREIPLPYTELAFVQAAAGRAVFLGGSPSETMSVVELDLASGRHEVLRRATDLVVSASLLSPPEAVEFPAADGAFAHGLYFRPQNPDFQAPANERPPLLVKSHGGPTGAASTALDLETRFWTSRGFAVLDVCYGGSTGFGRAYRERLLGKWGVVDVDDCVSGALYLADRGDVDGGRLAIEGGSAGGFTTLCALTFRDVFHAGASFYGVSDLEALVRDTHKFESRYLDRLIGPYPERADLYVERSPIHFAERLSCPVIFFQGLEDAVVPPNQTEAMVEVLRARGLEVAYVPFEGEQHGFRRAASIRRALEEELSFFARVFGFIPAP